MIKRRNGTKAEKCIMYGRRQAIKKSEREKGRMGEWEKYLKKFARPAGNKDCKTNINRFYGITAFTAFLIYSGNIST
jgi:hypothetical protein